MISAPRTCKGGDVVGIAKSITLHWLYPYVLAMVAIDLYFLIVLILRLSKALLALGGYSRTGISGCVGTA